ncbi:MAG TPA: hypothetical protein DCF96_14330 [Rhodobacteraceae bacterium]|nr:hypothetical protein [Paracoccaceae bacterium]|tara:strand:+ start:12389 stop:13315 length:927 start_codon:yes stop_codon:yes gene_type:complete
MAKYARGKKSQAISDRGGLKVPYTDLMTTWDGLRVSPDDWEPKQPQLTPAKNVVDATALFNPRPDTDPENAEVFIGYNFDFFTPIQDRPPVGIHGLGVVSHGSVLEMDVSVTGVAGTGAVGTVYPNPAINPAVGTGAIGDFELIVSLDVNVTSVIGTGALGDLIFATTVTGVAGTGAIGTEVPESEIEETGVAGTGAIGAYAPENVLTATGVAGTGATGAETAVSEISVSGISGTGSVHVIGTGAGSDFNLIVGPITGLGGVGTTGSEIAETEISETGLAGTGAIGSVDPAVGWGNNAWGNGTWGNGL